MTFQRCLSLLCLLLSLPAAAQRGSLGCAGPMKMDHYYRAERWHYTELSVGYLASRMYRNDGGSIGDHFRFHSNPYPVFGLRQHQVVGRLEIHFGIELTGARQGLQFTYQEEGVTIRDRKHAGTLQLRIPVGLTYQLSDRWSCSLSPYLAFTTLWEQMSTGSIGAAGNGQVIGYSYLWDDETVYDRWHFGLALSARVRIAGRLYGTLLCSADLAPSAPSAGTMIVRRNGGNEEYTATVRPWLLYYGAGLAYRIRERRPDNE